MNFFDILLELIFANGQTLEISWEQIFEKEIISNHFKYAILDEKMDEMVRVEKDIKEKIIFKTELENFRKQTPLLC